MFHRIASVSLSLLIISGLSVAAVAQELTEGNASNWTTFASDGAAASVSNSATYVKVGAQSIRFDTLSGFDTGVRYPRTGNPHLNVSAKNYLVFWAYAINNNIGFQDNQPVVVLKSTNGGKYTYTPQGALMTNNAWRKYMIPLAGDATWVRTTTGAPTLADVSQIEIHQDTWDYGFTVYYDGLEFAWLDPSGLPPAGPPPPPGVNANAIETKALLFIYDAIMENRGNRRLHEVYGWPDPVSLTNQIISDFRTSSHDLARYRIVETVVADEYPWFRDGTRYTDASFAQFWEVTRDWNTSGFDYNRFIADKGIAPRIMNGEIDEVWVYGFPGTGMWESTMAGNGGYWCNSGPVQNVPSDRLFIVMGWNYERGVAEAIHSWGHRAESIMVHTYGSWSANQSHSWNKFALLDKDSPGNGGVGNCHYPVNGMSDYDYANTRYVTSNADDWYTYPTFYGLTRSFNYREWSPSGADSHREYLNWWYNHMPHFESRGPDYYLNNWWRYMIDVNQFKANSSLFLTSGIPTVSISSPTNGASVSGTVQVAANAAADGALGRVDLYVDGVYVGADNLWPYTFDWDTAGLVGPHTLVAKAYELQNGTETVSAPVVANVVSYSISGTITSSAGPVSGVSVTATGTAPGFLRQATNVNAPVPDFSSSGVTAPIDLTATGTITSVSVGVTVKHPRRKDLEITLIHPDGTSAKLHNRTGHLKSPDVVTFYPDATTPSQSLAIFNGKPVGGQWRLVVKDLASGVTGMLESWSLGLRFSAPFTSAVASGANGAYTLASLPNGTFTVTPSHEDFTFSPVSRTVTVGPSQTGKDFIGARVSVTLTGTVKLSGWEGAVPPSTVLLSVNGVEPTATVLIGSGNTGIFTCELPPSGTHQVRVYAPGFLSETVEVVTSGIDVGALFDRHGDGLEPGDTDGSNAIDDADLTAVILDYGTSGGANGVTDTNGDGLVDDADLTLVVIGFGLSGT